MERREVTTEKFTLMINGEPVEMEMTLPVEPIALVEVLPLFWQMTESFLEVALAKIESENKTISCQKGCGACCRQLVPVSEAEAIRIAALVESFPPPRRNLVEHRFMDACRHFFENGWFAKLNEPQNLTVAERKEMVNDYFREIIPCPFLEDESCSIHPFRPLACREYLVTSPAENCAQPTTENIERVKILFSLSSAVCEMEAPASKNLLDFVPLIYSLAFARKNAEPPIKKPATDWVKELFETLAQENHLKAKIEFSS